ncbi:DUF397 domain-containing protein [Nonomuraea sp. NBC_01738]|uniref:DUF397 domain-containing protein n=1 Tax=Nonomuraea sp. NBC_01738 TaxID=2976003 RepID=UPI002E0DEE2B|nr:DUF397 domain-containing protein [Nonomuraea sp. NBC_01738]
MINKADLARATWHKSTWSDQQGGCVSVASLGSHCAVRDSKNVDRYFVVSLSSWRVFVEAVKRGMFDPAGREVRAFAPSSGLEGTRPDRPDER